MFSLACVCSQGLVTSGLRSLPGGGYVEGVGGYIKGVGILEGDGFLLSRTYNLATDTWWWPPHVRSTGR